MKNVVRISSDFTFKCVSFAILFFRKSVFFAELREMTLNIRNIRCNSLLFSHLSGTRQLFILVSVTVLLFFFANAGGQSNISITTDLLYNHFDALYKLDQNLINGIKYYKSRETISGTEFFLDNKASHGKITVNGKVYSDVFLKYDLINQDIILEYKYPPGGELQIIIDDDKVTEFEIFDKTFRKHDFQSTGKRFFQIIDAGDLVCLIHWKKILLPVGSSLQYTYQYSEEKKRTYLLMKDQLYQFGGQKSFLKLFPGFKSEIKQYLNRYNLEIRNISDEKMIRLLEFCNDLCSANPKTANQ